MSGGRIRKELEQRKENEEIGLALMERATEICHSMLSFKISMTGEAYKAVDQLYTEAAKYFRAAKLRDPWKVGR